MVRAMRFLHTSDWHLGRSLHRADLRDAQSRFLDHLVETTRAERVDAVLVAGDVYDRAVPPVDAVALYDEALVIERCRGVRSMPSAFGMSARYAMKANSSRAILELVTEQGLGIDASSLNEVRRARRAGISGPSVRRLSAPSPGRLSSGRGSRHPPRPRTIWPCACCCWASRSSWA